MGLSTQVLKAALLTGSGGPSTMARRAELAPVRARRAPRNARVACLETDRGFLLSTIHAKTPGGV